MSKPAPPASLAETGTALWSEVVKTWDLRADELRTLEDACAASDMLHELTQAWTELGRPYITKGSMGQEVEHPMIGSIDKQRKARQSFIKQLHLPDSTDTPEARSTQARAAANARWSRRGA